MEVSDSGIVADISSLLSSNAAMPMKTTVFGMSMDFNPEPRNAQSSIDVRERGILIDVIALQW